MDASASLSLYVAAARPPRQAVASVQIVAVAYGAWLLGLTVFASSADSSKVVAELALLAGVVPAILQTALLPADTRGNGPGMWFMWAR